MFLRPPQESLLHPPRKPAAERSLPGRPPAAVLRTNALRRKLSSRFVLVVPRRLLRPRARLRLSGRRFDIDHVEDHRVRIERCHDFDVLLIVLLGFTLVVQEKAFSVLRVSQQSVLAGFRLHNFAGVSLGLTLRRLLGRGLLFLSTLLLLIGVLTLALGPKSLCK